MTTRLTLDRFAGDDKSLAVLLTDDGKAISVPRTLLPESTKAGDVLRLELTRDGEATRNLERESHQLETELDQRDPGGDIKL